MTIQHLLDDIHWEKQADDFMGGAVAMLRYLENEGHDVLDRLLMELPSNDVLCTLCERLGFMDKLVVWQDVERDVRLRVHVFQPGYRDSPHDHRFDFATRICVGSYTHRTFDREVLTSEAPMVPLSVRHERPGDSYLMTRDAVHSVEAHSEAITLVLRGPIVKPSATIRKHGGGRVQVVSAKHEDAAHRQRKLLRCKEIRAIADHVRDTLRDGAGR